MHIDKQIRENATSTLTNLSTTEARVYPSRAYPMQESDLPGLRVYVDGSQITVVGIHNPATQERDVELVVEFCDKASTNYDDRADQSKVEVEKAIANNNTLNGVVGFTSLTGIETDREGEGEQVVIVTRMTFTCRTYTVSNDPETPL